MCDRAEVRAALAFVSTRSAVDDLIAAMDAIANSKAKRS